MIRAVLFDMDGVLVDSEAFIAEAAATMLAERYGLRVERSDFEPFIGAGENRFISGVAEKHGVVVDIERDKARTYEIYFEIIRGRLREIPGAVAFVRACIARGLRIAIATSADGHKVDANLAEIGLAAADFGAVVDGLQVERKKPYPDIYIEAARRLGIPAADCLVIEDALTGIKAAKAAGCACLGVTGSFGEKALRAAGAGAVVDDLSGLDPGSLDELF
jgi:beta-phosphoglucomutase